MKKTFIGFSKYMICSFALSTLLWGTNEINVFAADGDAFVHDGIKYQVISEAAKTAGITGYESVSAELTIPATVINGDVTYNVTEVFENAFKNNATITTLTFSENITTIGRYAFTNCTTLSSVKLNEGLTNIGDRAFENCTSLGTIEIPKTVTTVDNKGYGVFYGCTGLKSVNFAEGITTIPSSLLENCTGLETVTMPDTVTVIEEEAFLNCSKLISIEIPKSVTKIGKYAFSTCTLLSSVKLNEGLTNIGDKAFENCTSLETIDIPKTVTTVDNKGYGVFYGCTGLKSVNFAEGITTIPSSLLENCTGLETVTMPETVTVIEASAFSNCSKLISVEIPKNVTKIGGYAFENCTLLSSVKLNDGLTNIGDRAFQNCTSLTTIDIPKTITTVDNKSYGVFYGCTGLKSVNFAEGITTIPSSLLENCTGLETVTMPDTVTVIEEKAFYKCSSLTAITLPVALTTIENSAFENCTKISAIKLPQNVTKIGKYAFLGCTELSTLVLNEGLTEIGSRAFQNCIGLTTVDIPKTLATTGSEYYDDKRWGIFSECTNLKTVNFAEGITAIPNGILANSPSVETITLPDSVTTIEESAFEYCTKLSAIKLPQNVKKIGRYVFVECTSLSSVTLNEGLTEIGARAFYNCTSLTTIDIPKTVVTTGSENFDGKTCGLFPGCTNLKTINLPEGITAIPNGMFANCTGLEAITIPDTVMTIKAKAFSNCENLTTVNFSKHLTTIESNAFENCVKLSSVTLPTRLTTIGSYAFYASGLTELTIPNSVTSLGEGVLKGCTALASVTIPESITTLPAYFAENCTSLTEVNFPIYSVIEIGKYAFASCSTLANISLPESIQTIKEGVFKDTGLTTITIPSQVRSMGSSVFENCKKLETAILSAGLTEVPAYTFKNCESLTSADIPYRVTKIGQEAFSYCIALKSISIPKSVSEISADAFSYPDSITIHGTEGSYANTFAGEKKISFVNATVDTTKITFHNSRLIQSDTITLKIDETVSVIAAIYPLASTQAVTWTSSDPKVAMVDKEGNVKAIGEGTAVITVISGSTTASFTVIVPIVKENIKDFTVRGVNEQGYTGEAITLPIEVISSSGTRLTQDIDYTISYAQNIEIGIATVTLEGMGRYEGTRVLEFQIVPMSIENFTLSGIENKVYTGQEITFPLVLKNSKGIELVKDVDYTVIYVNNSAVGTATVELKGIGNYSGKLTKNFVISPISIANMEVAPIENQVYTGGEIKPSVVLLYNGNSLVLGTDYNCTYSEDCINAGIVTVTLQGIGNYTGTIEKTYQIEPIAITEFTVEGMEDKTYVGSSILQNIKVVDKNGNVLVLDQDYWVQYMDNFNAGTATISITGMGNYTGSITKTFSILPAPITRIALQDKNYMYDGTEKKPGVTVYAGDVQLVEGMDYQLVYGDNVNAGTGKVTVVGIGNYAGTLTDTFTINQSALTEMMLSVESYVYDGSEKRPSVVVKCGNVKLVEGTDYEVIYSNNINIGIAEVTVQARGKYQGTLRKTFTIKPISITTGKISIACSTYTYNGKAKTPSVTLKVGNLTLKKSKDYSVTYTNNISIGTATVTVRGIGNCSGTLKKTFKIVPKQVTGLKAGTSKTSTISFSWSKVEGVSGYTIYRATSKNGVYKAIKTQTALSCKILGVNPGSQYYFKVRAYKTVNKTKIYGEYSKVITAFTLPKAPTLKITADTSSIKVTWNKLSGCKGYEIYMATAKNGAYKKIKSANSATLSCKKASLSTGKVYYFKARSYYVTTTGKKVYSEYSKVTSGMKIPKAPTLKSKATSDTIKISWNKVSGCVGYELYMSTSERGTYKKVKSASVNVVSYTSTGLNPATTYYYKIRTYVKNTSGKKIYSAYSSVKKVTTEKANPLVGEWSINIERTTQLNNKDLYAQFGADVKYGYGMTFYENMTIDYHIARKYGGKGRYNLQGNQISYNIDLIGGGKESGAMQFIQENDKRIIMNVDGYQIEWNKV